MTRPSDIATLRARKRILDGVTVWTVIVVSVAVAVPWFLRLLPIDVALAARAAFGYTLLFVTLAALTDRLRGPRLLRLAPVLLQASAIVFLGLWWHLVGGLQIPMFLLAFLLPVMATGIVLGRWQGHGVALLSVAVVSLVALAESRELRWYLAQIGLPMDRVVGFLPPRPDLGGEREQQLVPLELFAVLLLACTLLSRWLLVALEQLSRRLAASEAAQGEVQGLFEAALRSGSGSTVVVCPDDGQIVLASDGFRKRMLRHGEDLVGADLFEVVRFAQPARVHDLLRAGGELPFCRYHVGREARAATLRVDVVRYGDARYACVRIEESTELTYLAGALQTTAEPLLLVGSGDRLCYANRAAGDLFGELYFGMDAPAALAQPGLPERWWSTDDAHGRRVRLQLRDATYLVSATQTTTPDEGEVVRIVRLGPEPGATDTVVRLG